MKRLLASLFLVMAVCCHINAQNKPESAPKVISVFNQKVDFSNYETLYDFSFDVTYTGATSITIGVEQEYSSWYDIIHVHEASPAHVDLKCLSRGNMVWVDIIAENEYGKDTLTIELPVMTEDNVNGLTSIDKSPAKTDHIDIYSLDGRFMKRIKNLSELSSYHTCTLLLQYYNNKNQLIRSKKISLK